MKTIGVRLDLDESVRHPMHDFVADHEAYGPTRLLQWSPEVGSSNVLLFYVEGPRDPFLDAVATVDTADVVEPSGSDADGFYLFVRERLTGTDRNLVGAFASEDVLVVPPVVYDVDGSMALTVVGAAGAVQRALDGVPDAVDVSVRQIHSATADVLAPVSSLSDRQREVVTVALDAGYYEQPRKATVTEVADRLDRAPSTVAEHLRKAEAALVRQAFDSGIDVDSRLR